jgi:signal peptidase I
LFETQDPSDNRRSSPEPEATASASQTAERPRPLRLALSWLREVLETVLPAVLIALLINLFLAQATRVYGQSMEPTLRSDQRLVIEKLSYQFHSPRRGDVVVLRVPEQSDELLIKRVVGLPGETIDIREGRVYVDGKPLDEPYVHQATRDNQQDPVIVPPLHVFVMGDNRGFSNDSRSFGVVPLSHIVGRAWFSYWPVDRIGPVQ